MRVVLLVIAIIYHNSTCFKKKELANEFQREILLTYGFLDDILLDCGSDREQAQGATFEEDGSWYTNNF